MNQAEAHIFRGNNLRNSGVSIPVFLLALLSVVLCAATSRAQGTDQHPRKMPVIDKLSTGGPAQQMFLGSVKSLDLKHSVLDIVGARDGLDEYFAFKKSVRVSTVDGKYATLDNVKTGWNVLVYYQEKDNGPSIKEIVLMGPAKPHAPAAPAEPKKSEPPPS